MIECRRGVNMFLPVTKDNMISRGWEQCDFIIITGDAYVDHPSFGTAIISRVLEAEGYRVGIIPQPDWKNTLDFKRLGKPRLGFLINSGNVDSMVAHYTVAKKIRTNDYYSPGGKAGFRPDRAVIVYCNRVREIYGDIPIIIGGVEASTRRFAHYDYWTDKIRRSILIDSGADLLSYGMGENSLRRIAFLLDKGAPVKKLHDIRGTCFVTTNKDDIRFDYAETPAFDEVKTNKDAFAKAFSVQYENQDPFYGKAVVEDYGGKYVVQNPPMYPLTRKELDFVYSLPYERNYHPMYEKDGGVPAIEEVKFSVTHNRGCFGSCNFCSIAFHQGRIVTSRSIKSVVEEAEIIAAMPDFKGYIHDIGGPTANFRRPACKKQGESGTCKNRKCLHPVPCKNLDADHSEYIQLLEEVEKVKGVKKVFIRSGIRYDFMLADKNKKFFRRLVDKHVSGQLKVAPEHVCDSVLCHMGKPGREVYDKFMSDYYRITKEVGKEQYLVPYLMSSHPGSTINDAIELALYLKKNNINPEQVQDFYPTPGTASTCMYYTGINPLTGEKVYVAKSYGEKKAQRALLQFYKKENFPLIRQILLSAGRSDLIGYSRDCLVPPAGKRISTDTIKRKNMDKKYNGTKRK
jgi:uncharacterized radical SAM protein YgiQ